MWFAITTLIIFVLITLQIFFVVYLPFLIMKNNGKLLAARGLLVTNGAWFIFTYGYAVYLWMNRDSWPVDTPGGGLIGIPILGPPLIVLIEAPLLMIYYLSTRAYTNMRAKT